MSLVVTQTSPFFPSSARWALRVLSWLAFGVSAYLAWHAIHETSVAGCGVGNHNGCDEVLNSAWSKWLGVPVAVLGLACYATLAALSVLLGVQTIASRWINTAFVALAFLAAGASIWFIALQLLVIGAICWFCMTTDVLGIAIGVLTAWHLYRSSGNRAPARISGGSSTSLSALRSAIPATARAVSAQPAPATVTASVARASTPISSRSVPLVGGTNRGYSAARFSTQPSLAIAAGSALALLVTLIGVQIVLPTKVYQVQQVALTDTIDMGSAVADSGNVSTATNADSHVAMRIPTDSSDGAGEVVDDQPNDPGQADPAAPADNGDSESSASEPSVSTADASPAEKRERKVSFLGGKLTLDTYQHPIIGSPEAPHIVVEMVSYDCPHCRKTSGTLKRALSRYGDQVAVIVLVLPLESKCNRLVVDPAASRPGACATARMALGVAKLKPAAFARFHDFLMSGDEKTPPPLDGIVAKAYSTVDSAKLRALRDSEELDKQIAANVELYDKLRRQNAGKKEIGLPIQILGDQVLSGTIDKSSDLYKAWEEHLGVKAE